MSQQAEKHDLVVTRVIDAPLEQVWAAWTESEPLMRWWGPTHFTCPSAEMDVREGGTSIVCMRAPADFGGQDNYSTWDYTEIVPLQKIEFIHNLSDKDGNKLDPVSIGMPPDFPVDQRQVLEFKSTGDGKTEFTVTEYGWTVGQMMEMSRLGMDQSLDKLEASLKVEAE